MNIETVQQLERFLGWDAERPFMRQTRAHPAIVPNMKRARETRVVRMVEQRDSFDTLIRDQPGVVNPFRIVAEDLLFIDLTFRISNGTASIVYADRFGHPDPDHPERSLSERHFFILRCSEFEVDHEEPLTVIEKPNGIPTDFAKQDFIRIRVDPLVFCDGVRFRRAIFELDDPFVADFSLSLVAPEDDSVHIVVRDPNRVVVAVAFLIARVSHARERTARRAENGI